MNYVPIIAGNWLTRSLIGAQLKEEGFEVMASATLRGAVSQLVQLRIRPDLLILESLEVNINQKAIDLLGRVCPSAPLIIIRGAWDCPSQLRWAGVTCELRKPLTIGQIVDYVDLEIDVGR